MPRRSAVLHLLSRAEGGPAALRSGYRGLAHFPAAGTEIACALSFVNGLANAGERAFVTVDFDAPPLASEDPRFELRDDARVIAHGELFDLPDDAPLLGEVVEATVVQVEEYGRYGIRSTSFEPPPASSRIAAPEPGARATLPR